MEKRLNLKEPMADLRVFADTVAEGLCFTDKNGIVRIWNSSAEQLYAVTAASIVGRPLMEFFPNALMEEVRASRVPKKNISHMPRPDTHIMISATPMYLDGEFVGVVSTERDYTEVIRLHDTLEDTRAKVSFLENEVRKNSGGLASILGQSPNLLKKIEIAKQIAPTATNVMVTGESGTGKELFATGIHELSGRDGLFIPINCSAIPSELFESEFFGYMPGAFTGASSKGKAGFFELANGGTLFLDEIGDMPCQSQAKLLRALQDGEVMRVGGTVKTKVDVRIISATNRDLRRMMQDKTFREDLFYRLNVVEIRLPSLRERKTDIPLLVDTFLRNYAARNRRPVRQIDQETMKILCAYGWPGNIRELMNVVENLVVTSCGEHVDADAVPEYIREHAAEEAGGLSGDSPDDLGAAVRILETAKILAAVEQHGGNKSKAAKSLNLPRATLYHKIKEYGLRC